MPQPIRGKVAEILTTRELAINVGSTHGVQANMLFDVYDNQTKHIVDPDTTETLGVLQRLKVRVKVTDVYERFSLATTFRKTVVNEGGGLALGPIASMLLPAKRVTKYETLSGKNRGWNELSEIDSYVSKGDPVVQVVDPEYDQVSDYASTLRLVESGKSE